MATFDVIGVFQNAKITAPPFNPKALVPYEQPLKVTTGEDVVVRMYCQNNDGTGLDITNWVFECTFALQQASNPAQAAPPPPLIIKRAGVIVDPNPTPQPNVPFGGIVEFTFRGLVETAFWFPWETDSYDIYGTSPGGSNENFVPTSNLEVEGSTTVFVQPSSPTPVPPWPYVQLAIFPSNMLPDPRTFPPGTLILSKDPVSGSVTILILTIVAGIPSWTGGTVPTYTIANLPLASVLSGQQVWLSEISQMAFSDGVNWYVNGQKLDRFLYRVLARGTEFVWPLDSTVLGLNLRPLRPTMSIVGNPAVAATPIYPASPGFRPFDYVGGSQFASVGSGINQTPSGFVWLYSMRVHDWQDNVVGYNSFGWGASMFTDVSGTGVLKLELQGNPIIQSAPGAVALETRYLVHLVYDGTNFHLYQNGALVGSAAGTPDFSGGFPFLNFGSGNGDFQGFAYGYTPIDASVVAADYAAWLIPAG